MANKKQILFLGRLSDLDLYASTGAGKTLTQRTQRKARRRKPFRVFGAKSSVFPVASPVPRTRVSALGHVTGTGSRMGRA